MALACHCDCILELSAQSWPNFLRASWLPDFSIWESGTIFRGMYSIIDLITQNGGGDRIFQSGRQWVNLVAFADPQVTTLSTGTASKSIGNKFTVVVCWCWYTVFFRI